MDHAFGVPPCGLAALPLNDPSIDSSSTCSLLPIAHFLNCVSLEPPESCSSRLTYLPSTGCQTVVKRFRRRIQSDKAGEGFAVMVGGCDSNTVTLASEKKINSQGSGSKAWTPASCSCIDHFTTWPFCFPLAEVGSHQAVGAKKKKKQKKEKVTLTPCRRNRSAPGRLRIDSENTPVTTDNSADAKKKTSAMITNHTGEGEEKDEQSPARSN
jgi:hypothetical protein